MKRLPTLTLIVAVVLVCAKLPAISQRDGSVQPRAESDIYFNSRYHASVELPKSGWRVFADRLKKEGLLVEGHHLTRDDVNAGATDLNGDGRKDFIVQGATSWLTGADNDWYWVVADLGKGYRVVLSAHTGVLEFRKAKSHGFRDIYTFLTLGGTEFVDRYRFDGRSYKAYMCTTKDAVTKRIQRYRCSN